MKTIVKTGYKYINSINHQNKLFVFVIKENAEQGYPDIYYSVQEDAAAEDTGELQASTFEPDDSWSPFEKLIFPTFIRPIGMRLGAYRVEGFDDEGQRKTTAIYTQSEPFCVTSDFVTITLFRKVLVMNNNQQPEYRIFADRFVYNTKIGKLLNVNEVRYIHSGNPDVPSSIVDSFGVQGPNGDYYLEPTSEIYLQNTDDFIFDVISIPIIGQLYHSIWHFFIHPTNEKHIEVYSIPRSSAVLFDTSFCRITHSSTSILPSMRLYHDLHDVSNIAAAHFEQQEETTNTNGEVVAHDTGTHVMIILGRRYLPASHPVLSLDVEVARDGFLAGTEREGQDIPVHDIDADSLSFYGTALEFDGRNDYVTTSGVINTDALQEGLTLTMWVNLKNDYSKPFLRTLWSLDGIHNDNSGSPLHIILKYNHLGKMFLTLSDRSNQIVLDNIPALEFNAWNNLFFRIPSKDNHLMDFEVGINGRTYTSTSLLFLMNKVQDSYFRIGTLFPDNREDDGFMGRLGEIRMFFNMIHYEQLFPNLHQIFTLEELSKPAYNNHNFILCESFSQGSGSVLHSYLSNDSSTEDLVLVQSFTVIGPQWVASTICSRTNMKVQYYDDQLLKCRAAYIRNEELQNTQEPNEMQTEESVSLLDSSDGILRAYYNKSDGNENRLGVAQFDPSAARIRKGIYWQNGANDTNYSYIPKIMLSSRIVGADMNDVEFIIEWQSNDHSLLHIIIRKFFTQAANKTFTITETWTNINPNKPHYGGMIRASDVVDIINGNSNLIEHSGDFVRTIDGTYHPNIDMETTASIIFHAEEVIPDNKGNIQYFPVNKNERIYDQILIRNSAGMDSTWILNPIPATLHLDPKDGAYAKMENLELPDRNFSIESWIRIEEDLAGESLSTISHIFQHHSPDQHQFICSHHDKGKVYIRFRDEINFGRDYRLVSDENILESHTWQHLALSYLTGYSLHFKDQLYVEVPHQKSLNTGGEFTMESWMYIPPSTQFLDGPQIIASQWDTVNKQQGWRIYFSPSMQLGFDVMDTDGNLFSIHSALPDPTPQLSPNPYRLNSNSWNHVCAQYAKPSQKNVMFMDEPEGDVHFIIEPFTEEWSNQLSIEFEAAIDSNHEDDEFTFLSYVYGEEIESDDDEEEKQYKGKNFLTIGRWKKSDIVDTIDDATPYNGYANNDQFLIITLFEEIISFDEVYKFGINELVHIALTVDIEDDDEIKLKLYINGIYYGKNNVDLSNNEEDALEALQEDKDDALIQRWVIGASHENDGDNKLDRHFSGYMTQLRVWNLIRTEQEIIDYINVPVDKESKGLVALYPMNDSPIVTPDDSHEFRLINLVNEVVTKPIFIDGEGKGVSWVKFDVAPKLRLLINGNELEDCTTYLNNEEEDDIIPFIKNDIFASKAPVQLGRQVNGTFSYLDARLDNVRIWNQCRLGSQINYYKYNDLGEFSRTESNMVVLEKLVAYWAFDEGFGSKVNDSFGNHEGEIKGLNIKDAEIVELWEKTWIPSLFNARIFMYLNAQRMLLNPSKSTLQLLPNSDKGLVVGGHHSPDHSITMKKWYIGELRLWGKLLFGNDIKDYMHVVLSGDEYRLRGYWRLDDGSGKYLLDRSRYRNDGIIMNTMGNLHASFAWVNARVDYHPHLDYPVPVSSDAQSCINISNNIPTKKSETIEVIGDITASEFKNATQLFLGYFTEDGISGYGSLNLETNGKAGEDILVYIGQGQYKPQIVGFIEGAPPVPSENLTVDDPTNPDKYVGTSTITFGTDGEVHTEVSNEKQKSLDYHLNFSVGGLFEMEDEKSVGTPFTSISLKLAKMEASLYADFEKERSKSSTENEQIDTSSAKEKQYSLTLGGSWEPNIYNLANVSSNKLYIQAKRLYRPNNMGIAVVKSRTADLYAIQNSVTKKTTGIKAVPDPNIPEDINYIMFKINPDYIKNGSLDGRIGFDNDIQYPDLLHNEKASYFKAQEAYQLQSKIEREQEEWKNTLGQAEIPDSDPMAKNKELSLVNSYLWTADGGIYSENNQFLLSHTEQFDNSKFSSTQGGISGNFKILSGIGGLFGFESILNSHTSKTHTTTKHIADTSNHTFNLESEVEGEGFLSMQADMVTKEVVNTLHYPDENLQEYISALDEGYENCIQGKSPTLWNDLASDGKNIIEKDGDDFKKFIVIKTSLETWEVASTLGEFIIHLQPDNHAIHNEFVLKRRMVAHSGQYPILYQSDNCPGKVTGYRFKSFFLHPSNENFNLLSDGYSDKMPIIDKEWLDNPLNPDAIAMKQALENPNRIWRILHRVTYVSRVPISNDIQEQEFGTNDLSQPPYVDVAAQELKKPDAISMDNNFLLIKTILGETGIPGYKSNIDPKNLDYSDVMYNIELWIEKNHLAYQLDGVEQEKLLQLMQNFFMAYLVNDDE